MVSSSQMEPRGKPNDANKPGLASYVCGAVHTYVNIVMGTPHVSRGGYPRPPPRRILGSAVGGVVSADFESFSSSTNLRCMLLPHEVIFFCRSPAQPFATSWNFMPNAVKCPSSCATQSLYFPRSSLYHQQPASKPSPSLQMLRHRSSSTRARIPLYT